MFVTYNFKCSVTESTILSFQYSRETRNRRTRKHFLSLSECTKLLSHLGFAISSLKDSELTLARLTNSPY